MFLFRFFFKLIKWCCYALIIFIAMVLFFCLALPNIASLRTHNPQTTSFIKKYQKEEQRAGRDGTIDWRWVPYSQISNNLKKAVLTSEDDRFFNHHGFDWTQMKEAMKKNWKKKHFVRGGSTISQQLVKNLYLGPEKSIFRKLREWILTYQLEKTLPKERIFELYLNVAEWGSGVYGAESAARYYFGISASQINSNQAAYLAAILPNPKLYTSKSYRKRVNWKTNLILSRMGRIGNIEKPKETEKVEKPEESDEEEEKPLEDSPIPLDF